MALNLNKSKISRKILLLAALCAVLGAFNAFKPLSLGLYVLQTKVAVKPVSGDIVVVGIDSPSISEIGRWPWPRDKQAELLRKIDSYNPAAIYIDIGYQGRTTPAADTALRNTLSELKAPTKLIALAVRKNDGTTKTIFSDPVVVGPVENVSAYAPNLFGYIWTLPIMIETERGAILSSAASIASVDKPTWSNFAIDYTYNPNSIPVFSAKDIFTEKINRRSVAGRIVILGVTDPTQHDIHALPGWGEQPGVFVPVLGAETLKNGLPIEKGWIVFFFFAVLLCLFQLTAYGLRRSMAVSFVGCLAIMTISTLLTTLSIVNDPLPALSLVAIVGVLLSRQKAALIRSQRNASTGLFNMTGYLIEEVVSNAMFIGATLIRAETRLGFVRKEDEIAIMKEVGHRLSTVIDEQQLTHNEKQQFLWEMPSIATSKLADHLEGLRQLFSEPLLINGRKIDIDIHFGVDRNVNQDVKRRMDSALNASLDASTAQSTFIIATTAGFDALLHDNFASEFETAINNGNIELVLEAQQNLVDGQIISAAAALRWTHPAYGQITTTKLFAIARKTGNLMEVSKYLSKKTIEATSQLVLKQPNFATSVKISADIVSHEDFVFEMVNCSAQENCRPFHVTFEVIDLHQHKFHESVRKSIRDMQSYGFRVGVGNFGITDADLDLIKKFQPDEIFLAKSFSAELLGSTSNSIFAVGALRIAKANNVIITADGIDDRDVLDALRHNGCDRGKGKIIAMPLNLNSFTSLYIRDIDKKTG